jgi:hypothetical protein
VVVTYYYQYYWCEATTTRTRSIISKKMASQTVFVGEMILSI